MARIAYTQLTGTGDEIFVYEIATGSLTSIPGSHNADPAIGGDLTVKPAIAARICQAGVECVR